MLDFSDLDPAQHDAVDFIASGEDALMLADIGTGKTVIGLTAADRALANEEVNRWLVLAPHMVAVDTWPQEIFKWRHLKHVKLALACGSVKQRLAALNSPANVVVMNYENLQWLLNQYPKPPRGPDPLPFDGLICDELDKLKAVTSKRFKELRRRIWTFRKRVGLTGTLVPNELTEVWGQAFIVDGGQSFGRSFYRWRERNFYPTDYQQRRWAPFADTQDKIVRTLAPLTFQLKAQGLPEVRFEEPVYMPLPAEVRARYAELEKEYYLEIDDLGRTRTVDAANAAVLSGKLQQICAGFSYVDKTSDAVWHSRARFEWLDELLKTPRQMLVFYHFNEERDELMRRHPDMGFLSEGGVKAKQELLQRWNGGVLQHLALHPKSAGHGLNLQHSGAHDIAFLTMPWSGGMFSQVVGRLARRGQTASQVNIHTALFKDTRDEDVFDVVTGKIERLDNFNAAMGDACAN